MKAPDKIYVNRDPFIGFMYVYESQNHPKECEEYIRKDALLEWAKEKQEQTISIREDAWWDEVINKLKSM